MEGDVKQPSERKIPGYRELDSHEYRLICEIKAEGEQIEDLLEQVSRLASVDVRWLSIAETDLQKGLMSLTRAVARPNNF